MTTISTKTFDFLSQLETNNNREWFQENKSDYLVAKENVEAFAEEVISEFRQINLEVSPDLLGKKSVMRIYRDVRFSKDKSPYKLNFGITIPTTPKGIHGPGFFIQLQPKRSFVAGGMWMPEAEHLKLIRQEIDYNGGKLTAILHKPSFEKLFGSDLGRNDKLKTTPKNYDASHPNIELLKLKSFTVSSSFADEDFQKGGIVNQIVNCLTEIMPFNDFLKDAIANPG